MPNGMGSIGGGGGHPHGGEYCGTGPAGGADNRKSVADKTTISSTKPSIERCEFTCNKDNERCVRPKGHPGNHYCCNGDIWK